MKSFSRGGSCAPAVRGSEDKRSAGRVPNGADAPSNQIKGRELNLCVSGVVLPSDHCPEPALGCFLRIWTTQGRMTFVFPPVFSSQIKNRPSPGVAPSFLPGWGHLSQLRAQERRAYPRAEAAAKPQRCGSERPIHGAD